MTKTPSTTIPRGVNMDKVLAAVSRMTNPQMRAFDSTSHSGAKLQPVDAGRRKLIRPSAVEHLRYRGDYLI